jgi:hypothetical protein
MDGVEKYYDEDGNLKIEAIYKNGERNGFEKVYLENGAVWEIQNKNNFVVSGVCVGASGKRAEFSKDEIDKLNKGQGIDCE